MTKIFLLLLLLSLYCCKKQEKPALKFHTLEEIKNAQWNPFNGSFVGCQYDVLTINVLNNQTIQYNVSEFTDWKTQPLLFTGQLALKKQYWEFTKNDTIQWNIFQNTESQKDTVELKLSISKPAKNSFDYTAKINLKNQKKSYHCDEFWYK